MFGPWALNSNKNVFGPATILTVPKSTSTHVPHLPAGITLPSMEMFVLLTFNVIHEASSRASALTFGYPLQSLTLLDAPRNESLYVPALSAV